MSRSGTAMRALLVAIVCVAPLACSGDDDSGPVLGPVVVDITIDTSTTDPAVYFEKVDATGDMLTVDVKMRTAAPVNYDAFTLEILFDPTHVQINQTFAIDTSLGTCGTLVNGCASGGPNPCDPLCCTNAVDANTSGDLLIGVTAPPGCTATSASEQTLTRLVFLGATAGTSFLRIVDTANTGDCEILEFDPVLPNTLIDLGIPCLDGMAQITSTR